MKIKITYKSGNVVENKIEILNVSDGKLSFIVKRQAHPIIIKPVTIPLKNVDFFEVDTDI